MPYSVTDLKRENNVSALQAYCVPFCFASRAQVGGRGSRGVGRGLEVRDQGSGITDSTANGDARLTPKGGSLLAIGASPWNPVADLRFEPCEAATDSSVGGSRGWGSEVRGQGESAKSAAPFRGLRIIARAHPTGLHRWQEDCRPSGA
jgi:hypothetical protein